MKLLVVDDSSAMRMMVIRTLRQAGFSGLDITQASDGAEGFEQAQNNSFDLVLADWNMPNMTGIEMLEKMREEGNETTVGFITTEATLPMKRRAMDAGASFLIPKPFSVDAFKQILGPIIEG